MHITEKIHRAVTEASTSLIAGLDPDVEKIPASVMVQSKNETEAFYTFCTEIIQTVAPHVCGFKLNLAFFESLGSAGLELFAEVRKSIPKNKLVIADAKRGDIGNTAAMYARAFYERFDCDFITVNPLMGMETLEPYLQDASRGVFALTLTSNPGSEDFLLRKLDSGERLCTEIATQLDAMQQHAQGMIGMVTGATQASYFNEFLPKFPDAPLLIPGLGAQGGTAEDVIEGTKGHKGWIFPVISRAIIYASTGDDWKEKARDAALGFNHAFTPLVYGRI